jgi:hypothetical protein
VVLPDGNENVMGVSSDKEAALDLWQQMFARMAASEGATLVHPEYDRAEGEALLRSSYAEAGWSKAEIEERIAVERAAIALAPVTSPGVEPSAELILDAICRDIESAMTRLGLDSHLRVARGIEPLVNRLPTMTNVVMTDQGIVTVGSFFFRFCGLIARAFARTLHLNPWLWEHKDYTELEARRTIMRNRDIVSYWLQIYVSFFATGTQALVPFRPARKDELILFEQVARAMEIFAIAHEYGHNHLGHGRQLDGDPKQEEFQADQFALQICYKVEERPLISNNPYLASGAGGVVLLMALRTLRAFGESISGNKLSPSVTHPSVQERLTRLDSVAVLKPGEFVALKGFRIASERIMTAVDGVLMDLLQALPEERREELRSFANVS